MIAPVARFRLRPDGPHSLFVRVSIYATEAQLHRALRAVVEPPFSAAFVFPAPPPAGIHRSALVGHACFHLGRLEEGTVCHELMHAALEWGSRMKLRVAPDPRGFRTLGLSRTSEERLAIAQERMVNQFFDRARKLGVIGGR